MRLTELAQQVVESYVRPGDHVLDACAGNGHDTLFLAQTVGPQGRVYAVDIQSTAIAATRHLLATQHIDWVKLIHADHAQLATLLPATQTVRAAMFNLGYLPGADHRVITRPQSTLVALNESLRRLQHPGIISVLAYRAHGGGEQEYAAVLNWMQQLDAERYQFHQQQVEYSRRPAPVLFYVITR